MVKIDVKKYIDELRGSRIEEKGMEDLYSLKRELIGLSESSHIFENFEKESTAINKDVLEQIGDFNSLLKIRKLSSELKNKKTINEKLHTLHFNLNILKNTNMDNLKPLKNILDLFLYNNETKIDNIISNLNDFKLKLDEIKKHHSNLLPKSLDNKLKIENKYGKYIEQLYSIHNRQKTALISAIKLFLKMTKKHLKTLQKFKK